MKLFRLMKSDASGTTPRTGDTYGTLGVRPSTRTTGRTFDIEVDTVGAVAPGPDGLSTFDTPNRPDARHADWVIESDALPPELAVVPSRHTAGRYHIAPARTMTLAEFQATLASTGPLWERVTEDAS